MPASKVKAPKKLPARVVFGAALLNARQALEISQEELAHRAGMNRTYITDVERGTRNVAIDNLERLADAVDIPLWQLLVPPSK